MRIKDFIKPVIVIPVALSLLYVATVGVAAAGLGVAPSNLTITDALRGGTFEKTITIFNGNTDEDVFTLSATGEAGDWVTFYHFDDPASAIETIVIPGSDKQPILARFTIPTEAPSGSYDCTLYVTGTPMSTDVPLEGVGSVVKMQMPILVSIEVTGVQKFEGRVTRITVSDTEVGMPLSVEVDVTNTGNITATPQVFATFFRDGEPVGEISYTGSSVEIDTRKTITAEWDTFRQTEGEYTAQIIISLGDKVIGEQEVTFSLLIPGMLTVTGDLTSLEYYGEPSLATITKIEGKFVNTGLVDIPVKLVVEVYQLGNLVELLESDEVALASEAEETLTVYFEPTEPGDYNLRGHVVFGGKKTDSKEIYLTVTNQEAGQEAGNYLIPVFIAAAVIIFGGAFIFFIRKR